MSHGEIIEFEAPQSRWQAITHSRLGRVGIGLALLTNPISYNAASRITPEHVIEGIMLEVESPTYCAQPTEADLLATRRILVKPPEPSISAFNKAEYEQPDQTLPYDAMRQYVQLDDLKNSVTAKKYGLTVHPYEPAFNEFDKTNETGPFEHFFNVSKLFLAQYGISLEVGDAHKKYDEGKAPSRRYLELPTVKQGLMQMVHSISRLPVEFIDYVRLRHIVLLDLENTGSSASVDRDPINRTMTIDLNTADPLDVEHELSHLEDETECGPTHVNQDHHFSDLNGGNIYKKTKKALSSERFSDIETDLIIEHDNLRLTQTEQHRLDILKTEIVTDTEYSLKSVMEDKAEIRRHILWDGGWEAFLDVHGTRLFKKYIYLAARLNYTLPRIFRFIVEAHSTQTN